MTPPAPGLRSSTPAIRSRTGLAGQQPRLRSGGAIPPSASGPLVREQTPKPGRPCPSPPPTIAVCRPSARSRPGYLHLVMHFSATRVVPECAAPSVPGLARASATRCLLAATGTALLADPGVQAPGQVGTKPSWAMAARRDRLVLRRGGRCHGPPTLAENRSGPQLASHPGPEHRQGNPRTRSLDQTAPDVHFCGRGTPAAGSSLPPRRPGTTRVWPARRSCYVSSRNG